MQFATLFLIASAVLALPTGTSGSADSNAIADYVKRADGFAFPDDERRKVYVPKKDTKVPTDGRMVFPDELENDYTVKEQDEAQKGQDEAQKGQDQPQKGQDEAQKGQDEAQKGETPKTQTIDGKVYAYHKDNLAKDEAGNLCSKYSNLDDLNAIPVECYRPIFCNADRSELRQACGLRKFTSDVLDKEQVIKRAKKPLCMVDVVCRKQDLNHTPPPDA